MPSLLDLKSFYRKTEALLDATGPDAAPRRFGERLVQRLVEYFGDGLGLTRAQVYERRDGGVRLLAHGGTAGHDLADELSRRLTAGGSDAIAELPWAGETEAGTTGVFGFPDSGRFVVTLLFGDSETALRPAQVSAIVAPLQYAVGQHLRRREVENLIEEARAIQLSLLPPHPPRFGDFDIAAVSLPAKVVGGDFYDFIDVDPETLAFVVADAAGHGLPAALQARDVATGLRMGVERDLKITRTVEKLNRIIHRSGLASRFISMIFGELELNGNFSYINAGHPPALLLDDRGVHELSVGGTLLGPDPQISYKLGFAHVDRGAALTLYTDGVTERGVDGGEAFGVERLTSWLTDWRDRSADEALADLLERLRAFAHDRPFEDDLTVVFARRPR